MHLHETRKKYIKICNSETKRVILIYNIQVYSFKKTVTTKNYY